MNRGRSDGSDAAGPSCASPGATGPTRCVRLAASPRSPSGRPTMRRSHAPSPWCLSRRSAAGVLALLISLLGSRAPAQLPSPSERIDSLETEIEELKEDLETLRKGFDKLEEQTDPDEIEAATLLTVGETKLQLGGKAEILFIKNESGEFAPLGADGFTENPDPYLRAQRLRLVPVFRLNRWIRLHAHLDFEPEDGETRLRELVARFQTEPEWWFGTQLRVGLDDRFMRPDRRTKGYPLVGNAFWRRESMAVTSIWRFGDQDGEPLPEEKRERDRRSGERVPGVSGLGTQGLDVAGGGPGEGSAGAFDFAQNWGEVALYLSIGQGYRLDDNEVNFDGARFNDIVWDRRDLENSLSLRELGGGLSYARSFRELGELGVMGFFYDDRLRDESVTYLQQELTLRDALGNPVAGYGDSGDRISRRYGVTVQYFLPASTLFEDVFDTRRKDGLRLLAQWIQSRDGDLDRTGWFVQGSYRFSFGRLVADRYFRSLEPVVRYGVLDTSIAPHPQLPGTWDRTELVVGAFLEVTGDVFFKAEYTMHGETTGGPSVDNDELLVSLLLLF